MPRIRYIKPEAFTDEELGSFPPVVRWFFAGLWTQADCEGLLEDKPKELKLKLIPYDEETGEYCLGFLATHRRVVRYQVGNRRLMWIPNFKKHQKPHRDEKPRGYPAPPPEVIATLSQSFQGDVSTTHQHPAEAVAAPVQHQASSTGNWDGDGQLGRVTGNGERRTENGQPPPEPAADEKPPEPEDFEADSTGEFKPTAWGFWGWHNQQRQERELFDEPTPPHELKDWHDHAVAKVGIEGLIRSYKRYLEDPFAADRGWPFALFSSEKVWLPRANAPPRKPRRP